MTAQRRPGRPTNDEQGVGRDRIIMGAIEHLRGGHLSNSRRDIAAHVSINPSLINHYFPKGLSLMQEAIGERSDHWQSKLNELLQRDGEASDKLDALQQLALAMYSADLHLIAYRAQLAREGLMPSCIASDLRRQSEALFPVGDRRLLAIVVWGACEMLVRHGGDDGVLWAIFEGEALARGELRLTR